MTPDQVFSIANAVALCAWIALVVLPRQQWVSGILAPIVMPAFFALIYVAIIVTQWKGSAGGFSTLSAVGTLFSQPWLLLAGWVHYLAFDLFVGSWEVRDARERGIPQLVVVPCLLLTFLFGPAGWLLYSLIRAKYRNRIHAGSAAS